MCGNLPRARSGWTTLTVKEVYIDALKQAFIVRKKREPELLKQGITKVGSYANQVLLPHLAYEELSETRLKVHQFTSEDLIIRDTFLAKDFQLKLIAGRLTCMTDDSQDCIHVFFASQDPKVKRALQDKGLD